MSKELKATFTSHSLNSNSFLNLSLMVARQYLPKDDDKRVYLEWMATNIGNLESATKALGVEVEDGPNFARRLETAVTDRLSVKKK